MTLAAGSRVLVAVLLSVLVALHVSGQVSPVSGNWKRDLLRARDRQDAETLQAFAGEVRGVAPTDAVSSEYRRALANSYLSEVLLELGKKADAAAAARTGIEFARQALHKRPGDAEHHRLLGTLCGQIIPASPMAALSFGRCAREEIETALRLDPHLTEGYLARGVGNYYLPVAFGGGVAKAEADFRKAIELAPSAAEPLLWLGLTMRQLGRNAEARQFIERAAKLAPERKWIQTQLAKTPQTSEPQ